MTAAPAKKVRAFYCPPVEALRDMTLTALDHRILGVICLHDGMSRLKGNGAGCYASYKTLAAIVGTDITNFSKTISKLLGSGYISREPQKTDKRRFTLRVEYRANVVGEITNYHAKVVGETDNQIPKVVGEADFETGGNPSFSDAYYIPLKGEIDSVETGEIDSVETARQRREAIFEAVTKTSETLRKLEPHIKGGMIGYPDEDLRLWADWLLEKSEYFATENANVSNWANRLNDEMNFIIEQREERKLFANPF